MEDAEIAIDPALLKNLDPNSPLTFGKMQELIAMQRLVNQQQRLREINRGPAIGNANLLSLCSSNSSLMASFLIAAPISSNGNQLNQLPFAQQTLAFPSTCNERLSQLVGDIFIGNEMIPQVLDLPPDYPLELTYR